MNMAKAHQLLVRNTPVKDRREDVLIKRQRHCHETECEDLDCIRLTQDISVRVWTASDWLRT